MAKQIVGWRICILLATVFYGCAVASDSPSGGGYHPTSPPGIENVDAAIKDLARLLKNRQQAFDVLYHDAHYRFSSPAAKDAFTSSLLPHIKHIELTRDDPGLILEAIKVDTIHVRSDKIDIPLFPIFYEDLSGFPVSVRSGNIIEFPNRIKFRFSRAEAADAQRIADDLVFIQQNLDKDSKEKRAYFESKAAQYRAMGIKPKITEAQRKYIVQANALNQRKDYAGAIDMYQSAIEIDPTSYPEAYFNMALLSAQEQCFRSAINYMQIYLLFEPGSKDARSAQDKIYEWELLGK